MYVYCSQLVHTARRRHNNPHIAHRSTSRARPSRRAECVERLSLARGTSHHATLLPSLGARSIAHIHRARQTSLSNTRPACAQPQSPPRVLAGSSSASRSANAASTHPPTAHTVATPTVDTLAFTTEHIARTTLSKRAAATRQHRAACSGAAFAPALAAPNVAN